MSAPENVPGWLYHATKPARIFTTEKSWNAALESGEWFDSPAKVKEVEETFVPLTKTAITRMKVDERKEWAMKWFGQEYAETIPAGEVVKSLLKLQEERVDDSQGSDPEGPA